MSDNNLCSLGLAAQLHLSLCHPVGFHKGRGQGPFTVSSERAGETAGLAKKKESGAQYDLADSV